MHGTSKVTVTRNVGFDIMGHCFYLEDGTEELNEISYNLAAYIHTIGRPIIGYAQVFLFFSFLFFLFLFIVSILTPLTDLNAVYFIVCHGV